MRINPVKTVSNIAAAAAITMAPLASKSQVCYYRNPVTNKVSLVSTKNLGDTFTKIADVTTFVAKGGTNKVDFVKNSNNIREIAFTKFHPNPSDTNVFDCAARLVDAAYTTNNIAFSVTNKVDKAHFYKLVADVVQ